MGLATLYLSTLSPVHFWACLEATHALLGYFFPVWLNPFPIHLSPFIAVVMADLGPLGPQLLVFPTRLYQSLPSLTLPSRAQTLVFSIFSIFNIFKEVFSIEWKAWILGPFCLQRVDHHARWQSKIDQAGCLVQAPRTYLWCCFLHRGLVLYLSPTHISLLPCLAPGIILLPESKRKNSSSSFRQVAVKYDF